MRKLSLFVFCLSLVHPPPWVDGYGTGAPGSGAICESMIPQHGVDPQRTPFPYTINIDKPGTMKGGDKMQVSISAPNGQSFKGFYVMVKKPGDTRNSYGKFNPTASPDARPVSCFNKESSAMTHKDNNDKSKVTLEWIAPNEDINELQVIASVVKNGEVYWTHVPHPQKLTVKRDANFKETVATPLAISNDTRTKLKKAYDNCETRGCVGFPGSCIQSFQDNPDNPETTTCKVLVTFEAQGDRNVFILTGKSAGYIALGLSDDNKMGVDSVAACSNNNGNAMVARFYNPSPAQSPPNRADDSSLVFKEGWFEDGFIQCHFEQKDHQLDGINIYFRNQPYYYLLAAGDYSGNLGYHGGEKAASSQKIHISDHGTFATEDGSRTLYQLHGAFMITAWLLCASTGMFTARYYKLTHTKVKPLNQAFWFVLHVSCMFATAALTICGAVFIIWKKGALSIKVGDKVAWHPVLGFILFGLAICQVLIAFFRPHPGTRNRPIFNWVHWIIGNSAHIIGIACIFLANDLAAANLDKKEYLFTMMGAVLFHIAMHLIMSFQTLWADKQMDIKSKRAVVPGPMKPNGSSNEAPGTPFRTIMLILYFLGLLGCAVALIYFIWEPLDDAVSA